MNRPRDPSSLLSRVRSYVAAHPNATVKSCAEALGESAKRVHDSAAGQVRFARERKDKAAAKPELRKVAAPLRQGPALKADPTLRRYDYAFKPAPGVTPVLLENLPPDGCHWPVNLDNPRLMCGCPSETGRYCPKHEKMSGVRLPPMVGL